MLITIKAIKKNYKDIYILKKINNLFCIILNYGSHIYSKYKSIKIVNFFFSHTFINYFMRIVWRGKAYRVRFFKKNSKFTLNFGHSHWYKIIYNKFYFNFSQIKRQNYLITYSNRFDLILLKQIFNNIRIYSKYTKRGIRLKKNCYIKRFGKISQANSTLRNF